MNNLVVFAFRVATFDFPDWANADTLLAAVNPQPILAVRNSRLVIPAQLYTVALHCVRVMKIESHMNSMDKVIDVYKRDVDLTLIDESLRRTPEERIREQAMEQRHDG